MAQNLALNDDSSLKILVCGKAGVGKSALINSLFGHEVCRVNDPGMENGSLQAGTKKVTERKATLHSVGINVFDSPGLQDGGGSDDEYLEAMYEKCKDVDLVLYCIKMTTDRFGNDEMKSLELFTKKFGPDFWKRCVLVMTRANAVHIPPTLRTNKQKREYHRNRYNNMLKTIREELQKQGVSDTIRDNIPACAVGRIESGEVFEDNEDIDRKIWYVSDKVKPELEEAVKVEFLTEFWLTCVERMSTGPRWNLIKCTEHRLKPSENTTEILQAKRIFEEMKNKLENAFRRRTNTAEHTAQHGAYLKLIPLDERFDLKANKDHYERLVSMEKEDMKIFTAANFGVTVGGGAVGAAGGAATGAVIGSVVPVVGTAVGGLVGGIIGGVGGLGLGAIGAGIRSWWRS